MLIINKIQILQAFKRWLGEVAKIIKTLFILFLIVCMLYVTIIALGIKLLFISIIWILLLIYSEKFINER